MKLNEYQNFCRETAFFTESDDIPTLAYLSIALSGEVGELCNWVKKVYRDTDGVVLSEEHKRMKGELGDILWYVSVLSAKLGFTLEEIAEYNKEKIKKRIENGTERGSGDER